MASTSFPPRLGALLADRYQLRELLGSGGVGQVFRAWDVQSQRLVAVKVFNPARCNQTNWSAYAQIVTAAAAARQPDLVLPEGLSPTLTDTPLATSASITGDDLVKLRARTATVPWARALEIAERAAEILHAVYAATRIPHRDLKATNLMVTPENAVKVLDFGVAEFDEQSGGDRTRVDTALGVVDYKSPEQLDSNTADDKSDQFSLAVIIYEMICGQRPFTGPSYFEVARKILFQPAQPLVDVVPDAKVPPALDALLQRALQKRPADRYPDLQTMQRAIAEVRRGTGRAAATALRGSKPSKSAPQRVVSSDEDDVTTMQIQSGSRVMPNVLRTLAGQPAKRSADLPPPESTVVGPAPTADRTVAFAEIDQLRNAAGGVVARTVIDLEPRKSKSLPPTGGGERTMILGDDGSPRPSAESTMILGDEAPRPAEGTLLINDVELPHDQPVVGGTMMMTDVPKPAARWTLQKTLIVINVACGILILIGLVVLVLSGGEAPPPTK